jgi:O-antigen ligase
MIPKIIRLNVPEFLIFAFIALGPLGNILTPFFLPDSFRTYYFLLPFFPLLFKRVTKSAVLFFPLFIYCFISAAYVEMFSHPNEPFPLFRFFLFFCQFYFVIGAAAAITDIRQILKIYLNSYFVSLLIGWIFFIGFYLKFIPLATIQRFEVLTQFAWGLLRFSPGSYPNEYGIVSSFVLSLFTIAYFEKEKSIIDLKRNWFFLFFFLTFTAFLLATTRAAYLSYFISMIYLLWKSEHRRKNFIRLTSIFSIPVFTLLLFNINIFTILFRGFSQKLYEGSSLERYAAWTSAVEKGTESPLFGLGFASLTNIHNVYLQLLFELGIVGLVILAICLFIFMIDRRPQFEGPSFLNKVRVIGLIHVLSFAATNHNINHHLTWFVFLLFLTKQTEPVLD